MDDPFRKYPSRAWAAALNKYFLLIVAVLGVISLPALGFTFENLVVLLGLCVVTFFEYRVHRYFRTNDPRAPGLGYRNQSGFAAGILVYCLYSAFAPFTLPPDLQSVLAQSDLIDAETLRSFVRFFYLLVAVLAGGSQFGLALYYRGARAA